MTIIYAILMFCVLIFIHELGHFIAAKATGVKVNEFSLGMGPAILKKQKGETLYALRVLPIGGYCAMEGEMEDTDDDRSFQKKAVWQKMIIIVAGSAMNLLLCLLILTGISLISGTATTTIHEAVESGPAYESGIRPGDRLLEIDGKPVETWNDAVASIGAGKEKVDITVKRGEQMLSMRVPLKTAEDGRQVIEIVPERTHSIVTSAVLSGKTTWQMTKMMGRTLKQLLTGDVSTNELSGPVGIVYSVNDTAKHGMVYLFYLMALISLNLAFFNMLPWPALDGGRLLFLIIRAATGKTITDEIEARIHTVGILLLFGLMIYVTWNDIIRFIVPIFN